MSSRASRKAALAKFRSAKRKRELGEDGDDVFENIKEEEDVYDVVDEDEYKTLVESRRQREDFVVDDDGLGYYDDGEERLGGEDEDMDKKKRSSSATANLTAGALKKARKAKLANQRHHRGEGQGNNDEDDDVVASNRSMWDFVKRGTSASAAASTPKAAPAAVRRNVDDLLGELDNITSSALSTSSRRTKKRPQRRPVVSVPVRRRNPPASRRPVASYEKTHNDPQEQEDEEPDDSGFTTFGDHEDEDNVNTDPPQDMETEPSPSKANEDSQEKENSEDPSSETPKTQEETATKPEESNDIEMKEEVENEEPKAPKRLVAPKRLLKRSTAAQKAAEEQNKAVVAQVEEESKPDASITIDTSSISFSPEDIAAETTTNTAAAATLESYVVTEGDDDRYLDFFWMDAAEFRGDIHLYGKVASPTDKNKFVSCCAVVKGNLRNLFVLPRKMEDGSFAGMEQVHGEMNNILKPKCIPRTAGASWAGKVVDRQYAFDDPAIPRETTQYLKVVYDAKYPTPEESICSNGGEYIQKILNARASTLETFILKRKLMGPCWLRIKEPQPNRRGVVSWCNIELEVETPKQITRLDLVLPPGTPPRASPPVVSVALKLKTIVNPQTQKIEIVAVSAVCHKNVLLDTASDTSRRHMTQLSLIRPIHLDGSSNAQGMAKFPRDLDAEIKAKMPNLQRQPNERAMLSCLVNQIGKWDPDVLVGHNAWGHDMQVLLSRCVEHKVRVWSKFGRHRRMELPNKSEFTSGKEWAVANALAGRLLCDTYLAAKEHLRETTYSLKNLAETQLKTSRIEIEPMDTPQYFHKSSTIVALALHTLNDAQLVQRLMFKLQILPLSKQLTNIAGNLWSQTMRSNRAGRTEFLLLHEFHRLKFLVPEKHRGKRDELSGKAKYSGGLVLEPKKGLYDTFILLLDFNSLYPSLIQEYNLCFTTVDDWSSFHQRQLTKAKNNEQDESGEEDLPPLPTSENRGVLPKVIKNLVDRRRQVKSLMKKETNSEKHEELDIKQKAFKLTANSMYGCLGFSHSRFYAQPIAAMVTSMGRQTLQKTVEIAQSSLGLEVIYGDTDSIMINTRISDIGSLANVRKLGDQVKKEVNKLYKTLELEIDGVFKCMLLLKKKKYAAVTVEQKGSGEIVYDREEKGLDLVRRDWCVQSKDTGRYVLDQILSSDQEKEVSLSKILDHLEELAQKMRAGDIALDKFVITKGLSKHPNDYPDGKGLPHVHVAKTMIKNNRRLTIGDHIPYIICEPLEGQEKTGKASKSAAERARHPDEIERSGGVLKPDVEWYLTQQILPPVSRLCEPIEGLSQGLIAQRLGLDSTRYNQRSSLFGDDEFNEDNLVNYKPESSKPDDERFQGVQKLCLTCSACGKESEFPGVLYRSEEHGTPFSGFSCVNPTCSSPEYWGDASSSACMARIMNKMSLLLRGQLQDYYRCVIKCDDPACGLETRQLSVNGGVCLNRGCSGRMTSMVNEKSLQTQLKYFQCLFDVDHVFEQFVLKDKSLTKQELTISKEDQNVASELYKVATANLQECAYNWIAPSFWQTTFGGLATKQ